HETTRASEAGFFAWRALESPHVLPRSGHRNTAAQIHAEGMLGSVLPLALSFPTERALSRDSSKSFERRQRYRYAPFCDGKSGRSLFLRPKSVASSFFGARTRTCSGSRPQRDRALRAESF